MWALRLLLCIPIALIAIASSFHPQFHVWNQPLTALAVSLNGLAMVLGNKLLGPSTTTYFAPGLVMVVMYGFIMLGLRFVWATSISALLMGLHLIVIVRLPTPWAVSVGAAEVLLMSFLILIVG